MRNLTELLQEIPLDDMMGGLGEMKKTAENNERTVEQTDGAARIKSKAPAAAAIAACAVIAVVGAAQLSDNAVQPGSEGEDFGITTDAQDTDETCEQADENEINYMMSRLYYDQNGKDYELAKDNIRLMDGKVGEVEWGFENYDIRVADVQVCYPFYDIEIAMQTKDGSMIEEPIDFIFGKITANGESVSFAAGGMNVYGDKATGSLYIDMTDNVYADMNEDSDMVVVINSLAKSEGGYEEGVAGGRFVAEFKLGELLEKDKLANGNYMISLEHDYLFAWDMEHFGEQRDLEFYINGMSWSNCGLTLNISVEKGDEDMEDYELGWALDPAWKRYLKDMSPEELTEQDLTLNEQHFDSERDYYFVKLEYKDGTVAYLDYSDLRCIKNQNGSYTLYFNDLHDPYDSENVRAFLIGDGRIEIETWSDRGAIETASDVRVSRNEGR